MGVFAQAVSTLVLCYVYLLMGIMFTWPSSTLQIFSSPNTTLHRVMTEGEISLLGSLSSVGGLVSTPFAGVFMDKLGRKPCCIISTCMNLLSWSMISITNRVEVVLAAIFISGLSSPIFFIFTTFIGEISEERIRGTMTSGVLVFYSIGMLISYILGGQLSYNLLVYVNVTMSVIGVLGLFTLKESPLFLMIKGRELEAAKSVAYYRGVKPDSKEVQHELESIRRSLNPVIDDVSPEEEKFTKEGKEHKLSWLRFIKQSRSTRQAAFVAVILITASIFQGQTVLQVYAEPLFAKAVPVMSGNLCSIIFACINVVFGFTAAYLTDAAGRRPLVIYGSLAAGVCCLLLASQIHLAWGPEWLTAVAIFMFCIVYNLGGGNIPYVIIAEIFLPEVKGIITMLIFEWAWLCYFLILLIFNPLVSLIGLGPVFYIFTLVCFGTSIFSYTSLPETRGLPVDAIQLLFTSKKDRIQV